jgi:23S rRNA pseudouridine955/2504/2580 synthase
MAKKYTFKDLILQETPNYFIINKPPFISTLNDRLPQDSLLDLAKAHDSELQACHRLDKETSGVIVFAKNPAAYRHLSMQFEHRQVEKVYHCVIPGIHDIEPLQIELPILPLSKGVARVDFERGKPSSTKVKIEKAFRDYSLMACKPLTGRMHQIRVHLAHVLAPLVGDDQYGGKPFYLSSIKRKYNVGKGEEEQPLIKRFALHACAITFQELDGTMVTVNAPYPKDFAVLLKQLEKFNS